MRGKDPLFFAVSVIFTLCQGGYPASSAVPIPVLISYTVQCVTQNSQCQVSLNVCMLRNCSAVSFSDAATASLFASSTEGRNFIIFCPCVEHRHSHTIVIGNYSIDLITEGSCPCSDRVTSCCSIPCCTCWSFSFPEKPAHGWYMFFRLHPELHPAQPLLFRLRLFPAGVESTPPSASTPVQVRNEHHVYGR